MFRDFTEFNLREWRKEMGFSQRESAESLCVDISTFQRHEKAGKAPAGTVKLAKLMLRLRELAG